ncbi:MAG: conjugal transfer protein, partial [Butyricicoccus sp.]
ELSYYVSGDSMPPVKCADYVFSQLKSTVLNKDGDTVTATVAVEYLDSVTKMTQISQFELVLKLVDGNWKIIK